MNCDYPHDVHWNPKQHNLVVEEYGIQTLKVVVVVLLLLLLSFDVFVPTIAHPSLFFDKVVRRDILECQLLDL